ncbi:hypothetical protein [Streptomyces sp. NPDC051132]|uniref:hypothetical protein n=1 Tax=unclassified Streptomyces TaxID=2593676 RepID=UPI00343328C8
MSIPVSPPPLVQLPLDPPRPVPGCAQCAALVQQRVEAHAAGDFSRVSDCHVLMRRHARQARHKVT